MTLVDTKLPEERVSFGNNDNMIFAMLEMCNSAHFEEYVPKYAEKWRQKKYKELSELSAISEKEQDVKHCWLMLIGSINLLNDVCIAQRQGICSCKVCKLSCDYELPTRLRGQGRGG